MSLAVQIRTANPTDASAIREVHVAAGKGPDSLERNNANVLKWLDARVPADYLEEMQREQFVVAEIDGQVRGFGAVILAKAEISSVYVDPAYRRQGIASALVAAMEQIAIDNGLFALELQAAGGALTFYEKQGFSYVGEPPKSGPLWAQMRKSLQY
jgi:GNAT superfamily N-acetyltransferase